MSFFATTVWIMALQVQKVSSCCHWTVTVVPLGLARGIGDRDRLPCVQHGGVFSPA